MMLLILLVPFSRVKLFELARNQDPSKQNRFVLWGAAVDMLRHSPVLGVGLAGFHEKYQNYPLGPDRVVQNYPHNFFLNFWLETGLFGLLAITALLILFYRRVNFLRSIKKWPHALPIAAGMMVIVLHGLVDVPYFKNDLAVLFWTIFALPFSAKNFLA